MKEDKDTRLVEVFTGSPWEAEFTKGLLESNGIESILKDGGGLAGGGTISVCAAAYQWRG